MTSTDAPLADRALTRTSLTLEDAPALTALLNRMEDVAQLGGPVTEESTRERLGMPGLDLARDSVAVRIGEELIGFAVVDVHRELDRDGRVRCQLMGGVDPAHRRQGLGSALLAWSEDRAAELVAERHPAGTPAVFRADGGSDPAPEPVEQGVQDAVQDAEDAVQDAVRAPAQDVPLTGGADVRPLLAQRGYRRVRSWLLMIRELPGAALPEVGTGEVRVIALEDAEVTRLAHLAAFADHWGSAPVPAERWALWWDLHTARRELSSIAVAADGTVLAYALAAEDKPGTLHITLVGTRPEGRGRGLARAVIARTLAAAAKEGYAAAELEVDSESLTGATRLYDGLGFERDAILGTYEKTVGPLA